MEDDILMLTSGLQGTYVGAQHTVIHIHEHILHTRIHKHLSASKSFPCCNAIVSSQIPHTVTLNTSQGPSVMASAGAKTTPDLHPSNVNIQTSLSFSCFIPSVCSGIQSHGVNCQFTGLTLCGQT